MLRFLGNNYNEKQLLQIMNCLNEGLSIAIDLDYDKVVISDLLNALNYVSKKYNESDTIPVDRKEE